jgi:hypothetical protein
VIWHNIKVSLVSTSLQESDLNYEVTYIFVLWVIYRLEDPMEGYVFTFKKDPSCKHISFHLFNTTFMTWHNVKISLVPLSQQKSDLNYEVSYILVLWVIYRLGYLIKGYTCTFIKRSIIKEYCVPPLKHHFHDSAQFQNKPGTP